MSDFFEGFITCTLLALGAGALMYLILCIDPNDPGILGKIHRLIYKMTPNFIK